MILYSTRRTNRLPVRTLLERIKGSSLDVVADYCGSPIVTLPPPFAQQIKSFELKGASSNEI